MFQLYKDVCYDCSKTITKSYSTSFSLGIRALDKEFRDAIYSIYGYVRFADEIVDTFHDFDKETLLNRFRRETYLAIEEGISLNPVLQTFQEVVSKYNIDIALIDAFLDSMEMDLFDNKYNVSLYDTYIYGSAEVVGLMCLKVFTEGDNTEYERLRPGAQALGSAFQKVNFLRDMKSDFEDRGRVYFPNVDFSKFTKTDKDLIEADIKADFDKAYQSILELPKSARFGVYSAYRYYLSLFEKIKALPPQDILSGRIRVSNDKKMVLLFKSALRNQLNMF